MKNQCLQTNGQIYHQFYASCFSLFPTYKFHVECLLFLGEDCFGVALIMQKINCLPTERQQLDLIQEKLYKTHTDSLQTCSETLPKASIFTTCHIEHFPPHLITTQVTREDSYEDNSDFKMGLNVENKIGAHYVLSKSRSNDAQDMSRSRITWTLATFLIQLPIRQ